MQQYILREDHFSYHNPKFKYASKGDKVTLIADRGNVLLVQGEKESFPIKESKLRKITL